VVFSGIVLCRRRRGRAFGFDFSQDRGLGIQMSELIRPDIGKEG